jgi:hypothetical protein
VPASQFAVSVAKPTEKELKDYFDKYKGEVASPYSVTPGFRSPERVEIAYFKAEVDKLATPENVTEDEIQNYYQKDATRYDYENKRAILLQEEKKALEKAAADQEKAAKDKAENAPADNAPSTTEPAKDNKEGEGTKEPSTDKPADKADGKSSSVEHSPYRQVSYLADEAAQDADQPKTETPAATTPSVPADQTPGEATPADAKPADLVAEPPKQVPSAEDEAKKAASEVKEEKRALTEEVKQMIRRRIAEDKIKALFEKIEVRMKENAMAVKAHEAAKIHGETGLQEPPQLDFEAIAKEFGVTAGNTGEITQWEARDTEIGKSNSGRKPPVFVVAFDNLPQHSEISTFMPIVSENIDEGTLFLFWKSKDAKEAEPKWEDPAVQKQVLEAWQLEHARKPALEAAKKLAEQAAKSDSTLKEAFAGNVEIKVIEPAPFTWMVGGLNPQNPTYELNISVDGVDKPGMAFMKAVFTATEKEVVTAMNEPQTVVYVIQVRKFDPSIDRLWDRFVKDDPRNYFNVRFSVLQPALKAFNDNLIKDAGLTWLRKPDQQQDREKPSDN